MEEQLEHLKKFDEKRIVNLPYNLDYTRGSKLDKIVQFKISDKIKIASVQLEMMVLKADYVDAIQQVFSNLNLDNINNIKDSVEIKQEEIKQENIVDFNTLVSYGERLLQHYSKKENPVTTLAKFNSKIKSYYVYDSCDEENVKLNDEIISLINIDCTIVLGLIGGLINYFLDFKR